MQAIYYPGKKLQYPVRVDRPDPIYAGCCNRRSAASRARFASVNGASSRPGVVAPNTKYREMLLHTATEEIGRIEMPATAVAMNLQNAPTQVREAGSADAIVGAVMGGENPRHIAEGMLHKHLLFTGVTAFPGNADGVPFDMNDIFASVNIAADMDCNVAAEATGRTLAVRRSNATNDPGMKEMWRFLIARDTMRRQQWLAVIDELGGAEGALPFPNSFRNRKEGV